MWVIEFYAKFTHYFGVVISRDGWGDPQNRIPYAGKNQILNFRIKLNQIILRIRICRTNVIIPIIIFILRHPNGVAFRVAVKKVHSLPYNGSR